MQAFFERENRTLFLHPSEHEAQRLSSRPDLMEVVSMFRDS
jgi:hypothetical protein